MLRVIIWALTVTFSSGSAMADSIDLGNINNWKLEKSGWKNSAGKLSKSTRGESIIYLKDRQYFTGIVFQMKVTPEKPCGTNWKVAGIRLIDKKGGYWQFGLIGHIRSNEKTGIDLKEVVKGKRGTSKLKTQYVRSSWKYGNTYTLILKLVDGEINGIVKDAAGKVIWQRIYELNDASVKEVTPVLRIRQMAVEISDLKGEGTR